ncbi:MAG: hypothetical protein ABFS86_05625 [Planctomycetota bacterium]
MSERDLKGKVLKLRYGLTTRVSERGAGAVYLGWDEDEGVQVVVRVPHVDLLDDDEFVARFLAADRIPADVPGLVSVIEIDRDGDLPYAIVSYVESDTVRERMKAAGGRLAVTEILPWIRSTGETLARLHGQGVCHRGVSPRSILVTPDGDVLLTDVAVAAALDPAPSAPEVLDPRDCAAPEAKATAIGPASDQYSLAASAVTVVMGDGFLSRQPRKSLAQALSSRWPSEAADVLVRALDPEPENRYPDILAFTTALSEAAGESGAAPMGEGTSTMMLDDVAGEVAAILETDGAADDDDDVPVAEIPPVDEAPEEAPPPEDVPPSSFRRKWLALAAGVLAVAIVAVSWLLLGEGGSEPPPEPAEIAGETPARPETPEKPPEPVPLPEFSAVLTVDEATFPALTREEAIEISGTLGGATGGWVVAGGRRVDPDGDGRFTARVPLSEGENEVVIRFFDRHEREGEARRFEVSRDTVAPKLSVTAPTSGLLTGDAEVTVEGRVVDDHPRFVLVAGIEIEVREDRTFSASVPLAEEGENVLTFVPVDAVGNEGPAETVSVKNDTRNPVVEILKPTQGQKVATASVEIVGTVFDPNLDEVTLNGEPIEVAADGTFAKTLTPAEGDVEVHVVAKDTLGHIGEARRRFVLDATRPAVAISSPGHGDVVAKPKITVKGHVRDPHPGPVELKLGETAVVATPDASGWFTAEFELSAGKNSIEVVATDRVGNRSEPVVLEVWLDTEAPEIVLESVPATVEGESVAIVGTVSEDGCVVRVKVGDTQKDAVVTGRKFTAEVPLARVGENRIEIVATDRVDNSGSKTITVLRRPPGPAPGASFLQGAGAGGTLNGERPAGFPVGLAAGDIVVGPATIGTPGKDVITVSAASSVQVQKKDRGVHVFFLRSGSATGEIGSTSSIGIPQGWLVVPGGVRAKFRAAAFGKDESRMKLLEGSGAVLSHRYSVILGTNQAVRLLAAESGDFHFLSPPGNATPITIRAELAENLSAFARVGGGYEGRIERLSEGRRVRFSFDTEKRTGKMPFVWTKLGDRKVEEAHVRPDQVVVVRVVDDPGEIRVRDK